MSALDLQPGAYYWHRKTDAEPFVLVRVVKSYDRLLAGPWSGGLESIEKMGGEWLGIATPRALQSTGHEGWG